MAAVPGNHVVLYVKAGWDGLGYGACPFCQRFFMVLDLKAKAGSLTFDVVTVSTARPPMEFRKFANKLPVLKHGDEVIMDTEEIKQYVDANFPRPNLHYSNTEAHTVCLDIFSKFSFFIKNVSHTPEHLLKELSHINDFLERSASDFMCEDELTHLDCNVLPKLQHIRVASKAFKDFDIPSDMKGVWRYLGNAYNNDTFKKTCPSDQEIVHHWSEKKETTPLPHDRKKFYTVETEPRYTITVPH